MASGSFSGYICGTAERPGYKLITSWTSEKNIAGNYSTVTCNHTLECGSGGWDLSIGSRSNKCTLDEDNEKSFTSASIKTGGGTTHELGTTTHKIEHNSDGKKTVSATSVFNIQASISGVWRESITATGTMVLDDIPRVSTVTVPDGTLGVSQNFKVTQADSSFYHVITYTCGTASGTAVSKTQNTAPPWTPPISLASQSPGLSTVTVTFTIDTYSGNTKIGSSTASATYTIPDSVKPSCSIAVSDAMGYLSKYGAYIQGKSQFKVTVTGTTAYSSPIKSYYTTVDGTPYHTSSFTTAAIKDWGQLTINSSVTDERGRTGSNSKTVTVLEYTPPVIDLVAVRANSDGTDNIEGEYIKIGTDWYVTPLNEKNTVSGKIKITKVGSTDFFEDVIETTDSAGNKIFGGMGGLTLYVPSNFITKEASYIVEASITDDFGTVTEIVTIPSAFTFFHFDGPIDDGEGKNKLNLFKEPESSIDYNGKITYTFGDDILTVNGTNVAGYSGMAMYVVPDVKKGDTVRFNVLLLDPECYLIINAYKNETDSEGVYLTEVSTSLSYIDGVTMSTFEHTMSSDIMEFDITFYLLDKDGSANRTARYKRPIVTINEKDMTYERFALGSPPKLGIGKMAELDNAVDFGLKARFNQGFELPIIPANTDLNTLTTTNFYTGASIGNYKYVNCPLTEGTFDLEVMVCGDEGQIKQRITACSKTKDVIYERYYYGGTWGEWTKKLSKSDLLNSIYPVGSIYMSVNSTDPKNLFGGTWARIEGKFLLGASSTYTAGSTGGAATVTLTVDQIPAHTHNTQAGNNPTTSSDYDKVASSYGGGTPKNLSTSSTGGGKAHNNMPPYLAVYVWKRTA